MPFRSQYMRLAGALLLLSAGSKASAFLVFLGDIPRFFGEPLWITAIFAVTVIIVETWLAVVAIIYGNSRLIVLTIRGVCGLFVVYNILLETGLIGWLFEHRGGCGCTPSLYAQFFVSPYFLVLKLGLLGFLAMAAPLESRVVPIGGTDPSPSVVR